MYGHLATRLVQVRGRQGWGGGGRWQALVHGHLATRLAQVRAGLERGQGRGGHGSPGQGCRAEEDLWDRAGTGPGQVCSAEEGLWDRAGTGPASGFRV